MINIAYVVQPVLGIYEQLSDDKGHILNALSCSKWSFWYPTTRQP